MKDRHYDGIDVLKGIACTIVVMLHVPFPGVVGKTIGFFLNFSVPVFFMITGYFAFPKLTIQYCKEKALRALKITFFSEALYGVWFVVSGQNVFANIQHLVEHPLAVILCGTIFNGTLWYLYAALWTWILYAFLIRTQFMKRKEVFLLIPVLFMIHIAGRQFYQENYNISQGIYFFRSALLFGLPMTMLGTFIASRKDKLLGFFKPMTCVMCVAMGGVISIVEYFISHLFKNPGTDFHVSTIVVSFGLFLLALNYPKVRYFAGIKYIGSKLYMWVYLSHIFVASLLDIISNHASLPGSSLYLWCKPILTIIGAALFGMIVNLLKDVWRGHATKG